MKKWFFIILFFSVMLPALAKHVAGGELFYTWIGNGSAANTYHYVITLRLFRDCQSTGPLLQNEQVTVGFYENTSLIKSLNLLLAGPVSTISYTPGAYPCLTGSPNVCYQVAYYSADVELPINAVGYTLVRSGCCRIDNITNLSQALNVGSTYVTFIPGTNVLPTGHNSSPEFLLRDTALICGDKNFTLNFGADDADGDSLTYSFCDGYTAPNSGGVNQQPTSTLSLTALPYAYPYSGTNPLGSGVVINPVTGIISGFAPGQGQYVVSVCITEWRNGIAFNQHRKDFNLKVQACDFAEAVLPTKTIACDSFTVNFQNQSPSAAITSYFWDFGEPSSSTNTSTNPAPTHTYSDTGVYKTILHITGPNGCVGSDSTLVYVYPGFDAGFTSIGSCYLIPFYFNDTTKTKYGFVNSWRWDFGDLSTAADTSHLKNPSYTYPSIGTRTVQLFVTSNKGCEKTVSLNVTATDKPLLSLPFHDTLICSIDTVPLIAIGTGTFTWTPNYNILNANTSTPLVWPKDTTTYYVQLYQDGCVTKDSIKVNVLDSITVELGPDSTICKTDAFHLNPVSYALGYHWVASTGEVVAPVKYPLVQPLAPTEYYVHANLGKCTANDSVHIKPVPYPTSNAGPDTSICFGSRAYLHANIVASYFTWSPTSSLINYNTLSPTAGPSKTTSYLLKVTDTLGCPKPVTDTVIVTVIAPVTVNAGHDTSVVVNQPLQLNATSNFDNNDVYLWTPATGLSNTHIPNPIATLNIVADSIIYKVRVTIPTGCYGEDEIVVRVFKTEPDIFVPSGFTPNGDGLNDVLKPITVGISRLDYFNIYNRWGQLLFSTDEIGKGWDGTVNGTPQGSGTFVFTAQGIDYKGKTVYRKGTAVLIR